MQLINRVNTRIPDELQSPLSKAVGKLFAGNSSALVVTALKSWLDQEGYLTQSHHIDDVVIIEAKLTSEVIGANEVIGRLQGIRKEAYAKKPEEVAG